MLEAKEERQRKYIDALLNNAKLAFSYATETGVTVDDFISYDVMATIVDYIRTSNKQDDLFEKCWEAYRRKGVKKKAREQWAKLSERERPMVLPHIKVYTATRDLVYQKDFERYLRDKVFKSLIVDKSSNVAFDPSRVDTGVAQVETYMPTCDGALSWNEYYKCYMYVGFWDGKHIADGYTDETRPDGATVTLNNGRGIVVWHSETREWERI